MKLNWLWIIRNEWKWDWEKIRILEWIKIKRSENKWITKNGIWNVCITKLILNYRRKSQIKKHYSLSLKINKKSHRYKHIKKWHENR